MSLVKGNVVYTRDLIDEAIEIAKGEINKRRTDLTEEEIREISNKVGVCQGRT